MLRVYMYLCYGVRAHEYLQWPRNLAREDQAGAVAQPNVPGEDENYCPSTPVMCLFDPADVLSDVLLV